MSTTTTTSGQQQQQQQGRRSRELFEKTSTFSNAEGFFCIRNHEERQQQQQQQSSSFSSFCIVDIIGESLYYHNDNDNNNNERKQQKPFRLIPFWQLSSQVRGPIAEFGIWRNDGMWESLPLIDTTTTTTTTTTSSATTTFSSSSSSSLVKNNNNNNNDTLILDDTTSPSSSKTGVIVEEGDVIHWNISAPASYALYLQVFDNDDDDEQNEEDMSTYYYSDAYLNPNMESVFESSYDDNDNNNDNNNNTTTTTTRLTFFEDPVTKESILLQLRCDGNSMIPLRYVDNVWEQQKKKEEAYPIPHFLEDYETTMAALQSCEQDKLLLERWLDVSRNLPIPLVSVTRNQEILQATATMVSGTFSVFGSSFLVFAILWRYFYLTKKKKKKYTCVRDRIIFTMSCIDILNSSCLAMGPFPTPSHTLIDMIGAIGSTTFCNIQGFGIQMGFGVPVYNAMLCIFYVSAIVFGRSQEQIQKSWQEFWMHAIPITYCLSASITGLVMGLYNSNGTFCWIEPYPKNCSWIEWLECRRGGNAYQMFWILAGIPMLVSCFVIVVSMVWLILVLWGHYRQSKQSGYGGGGAATARARTITSTVQAMSYIGAFFLTYMWGLIISLCTILVVEVGFWVHFLNSVFLPLQGFWNFWIFLRPTILRIRKRRKDDWFFVHIWEAMKAESINFTPPPEGAGSRTRALNPNLRSSIFTLRKKQQRRVVKTSDGDVTSSSALDPSAFNNMSSSRDKHPFGRTSMHRHGHQQSQQQEQSIDDDSCIIFEGADENEFEVPTSSEEVTDSDEKKVERSSSQHQHQVASSSNFASYCSEATITA